MLWRGGPQIARHLEGTVRGHVLPNCHFSASSVVASNAALLNSHPTLMALSLYGCIYRMYEADLKCEYLSRENLVSSVVVSLFLILCRPIII